MRQSIAVISLLVSLACAQDVVSFFFPGGIENTAPVATIETVNPSTTQFHLACPSGTDVTDCGLGPGIEYSIVSQTQHHGVMSYGSVYMSYGCNYNSKAVEMSCSIDQNVLNAGSQASSAVLSGSDAAFVTASVVEGASLLNAGSSATAIAAPQSTGTAASAGLKTSVSGSATATGSGVAATSTGAAARFGIEGSALLALAGAAALNMW